jgi:lysophospholipase L1-like esterase
MVPVNRFFASAFVFSLSLCAPDSGFGADEPNILVEGDRVSIVAFSYPDGTRSGSCAGGGFTVEPTAAEKQETGAVLQPCERKEWVYMPVKLPVRNILTINVTDEEGNGLKEGKDFYLNKTGALSLINGGAPVKVKAEYTFFPERYDSVFLDPKDGRLRLVKGVVRRVDAEEYIPETPPGMLRICNIAVMGDDIEAVPTWPQTDCVTGRENLSGFFSRLKQGDAVRLCGYGDSITAQGAGAVPGFLPNTITQDRIDIYFGRYGSVQDTLAKIETFDFGDGAGKKHCKTGWNWRLAEALDAKYGVKTEYLNCGIGSTTSGDTLWRPPAIANGLYPERIAAALAAKPDLLVLAFGMNERGSAATGNNISEIIRRFKAAGAAVIVMGVPKINGCMWEDEAKRRQWELTNDLLEKAAVENGAAFVDTRKINPGTVPRHWCSCNNFNHPGIRELRLYGRALASVLEER